MHSKDNNFSLKSAIDTINISEKTEKSLKQDYNNLKLNFTKHPKTNFSITELSYMFNGCSSLNSISGISEWNIKDVPKFCICLGNAHHYYLYLIYQNGILQM